MKPLSKNQYGALRELRSGKFKVHDLRAARDITVWSLFKRGYLTRDGRGDDAFVVATPDGEVAFMEYHLSALPLRKREADLTDRLRHYLAASKVQQIRKAG